MLDKEVKKSILDELKKVEEKIKSCLKDNDMSASGVNRDNVELLSNLKEKKEKLIADLEKSESADAGILEKLKLAAEAFAREASGKIDDILLSKKIKDTDMVVAEDMLQTCNEKFDDYLFEIGIKELKTKGDEVLADREIKVKHKLTGKNKTYQAGFNEDSIWYDQLVKDIKSGYYQA